MEFADTWTCGCGATNTGDVLHGVCWKCNDTGWAKASGIEVAEEGKHCSTCKAELPWHRIDCAAEPTPGFTPKSEKQESS